jgi:dTDP-4-amino-4,6-dideoxygalactose transaminase
MSKYIVPYTDLAGQTAYVKDKLIAAFTRVVDSGHYILGPNLRAIEERFAKFCDSRFAVGVASGTCALHLVWHALGIGPGDEIITVSNSFVATAASIALTGAKPVFVDIGPDLNIDPGQVELAITSRTKGILPVHLTGRPANMQEIRRIGNDRGIFVLEDAAQAVGASINGRRVGSWGNAAGFSLHPLKNLFAYGDGGLITTNDSNLYEKLLHARNHGLRSRERCDFWSYNSRLDELQAALLEVHMDELEKWTERRRMLAQRYNALLAPFVEVPQERQDEYCVYQTYVIQADERDELQEFLQAGGVEALVHYRQPIHLQPAAAALGYAYTDLPRTWRACQRILSLPLFPSMTTQQQDLVVRRIKEFHHDRPHSTRCSLL